MKIIEGYRDGAIPGGMVLGIGNFDGVHLGHQAIIARARSEAAPEGRLTGLLTFDPHPLAVVGARPAPPLIYTPGEKTSVLAGLGLDVLVRQPFDREFAGLSDEAFAREVLAGRLAPFKVVVGHDFRFGSGQAGDLAFLEDAGRRLGFGVISVEEVTVGGLPVRSRRIRELIAEGRVAEAAALLGRPFHVTGEVVRGGGLGRVLGFPTANILPPDKLLPPDGVYAGETEAGGAWLPSAVNIGASRFGRGRRMIESHILDFDGDLGGRVIAVRLLGRLREERGFDDRGSLAAQIGLDVASIRSLFGERKS